MLDTLFKLILLIQYSIIDIELILIGFKSFPKVIQGV